MNIKHGILLVTFAALAAAPVLAQEQLPVIPKEGKTVQDFIPTGWDTLTQVHCDINADKQTDEVLVLKMKEEEDSSKTSRLFLILFKTDKGTYELKGYSPTAVFCISCGGIYGDPFSSVTVKGRVVTIRHYGGSTWRWAYEHKFEWKEGDWALVGRTHYSYHLKEPCGKTEYLSNYKDENLLTGDVARKKIDKKCTVTEDKKQVSVKPLKKLSDFNITKDCNDNAID